MKNLEQAKSAYRVFHSSFISDFSFPLSIGSYNYNVFLKQ